MANMDMQIVRMLGDMMQQGPLDPELAESIAKCMDLNAEVQDRFLEPIEVEGGGKVYLVENLQFSWTLK